MWHLLFPVSSEESSVGYTEFCVVRASEAETRVVATLLAEICLRSNHDRYKVLAQDLVERLSGLGLKTVQLGGSRPAATQYTSADLGRFLVVLVAQEQPTLQNRELFFS